MVRLSIYLSLLLLFAGCTTYAGQRPADDGPGSAGPPAAAISYPEARRVDQVDDYFGVRVADPYRWMEAMDTPELDAWIAAQNTLSGTFLSELPQFEAIRARVAALWQTERMTVPQVHDGKYYFEYKAPDASVRRLMVSDGLEGPWRLLLDPREIAPDGTTLLVRWNVGPDGRLVAWAANVGGSDWTTWRIRRTDTGEDLPDRLDGTKFTSAAWLPDASGFYYARYPKDDAGDWDDKQQAQIWLHRIGTPQAEDTHVYSVTDHPTRTPFPTMSSDGRHLVLTIAQDNRTNGIYLLPAGEPDAAPLRLVDSWDGRASYLGTVGDTVYISTNIGAARGRVVAIDLARPAPEQWRDVVPESTLPMEGVTIVGDTLIVHYLEDAKSRVELIALDGTAKGPLPLPGIGKVSGFAGKPDAVETFYMFESFDNPGTVFRFRPVETRRDEFHQLATALDTSSLATRQVFYESKDGTRVPMFLVHGEGVRLDGGNPTMLYGYGGFNVSMLPEWDLRLLGWLDLGGVLAIANLRGGGEYGSEWHAAGTREHKQNVFDDFIAAAEWLIAERWTSPEKLAIYGRSNGGLLVGAVELQRPELFAAAGTAVGVLDMLRYHTPSANARAWSGDFGLSENEADFRAQFAYSPVHNTRPGTCYPATLIHSAKGDDRVVPWHSYKFAAALQRAQGCDRPVLLRVQMPTGHASGGAKPQELLVEEFAELYAFFAWALRMGALTGRGESGMPAVPPRSAAR
ncbi:MAG TPA: prolyl oligopeptidase family serine peptidase [Gammaproteobacteria bacterium]|nr:prolyl oligopeptidase family serine peptidase [Gammaproteobacteria bacterium]